MISTFFHDWKDSSQFRLIICLSACILIIKLILLFGIPINPHAIEDWYIAQHIADGNGYSLSHGPTALKTPVYPLFLTPWAILGNDGKFIASALQHILWFCAIVLFYKAVTIRFGTTFAFPATVLFTLHPAYLYYPFVLESTSITIPLFICFWYFSEMSRVGRIHMLIPMFIGWLTALSQPILIPGIIALQFFYVGRGKIISLLLTAIVIFAPWTIRNAMTFESFIPSKSPMWMNLYEGMQNDVHAQEKARIESARSIMNDVQMEKLYKPIVIRQLREHFPLYIERSFHRCTEFWMIPDRYRSEMWSPALILARILPQVILGIGLLFSFVLVFSKDSTISTENQQFLRLLMWTILYVSCVYSLTQASNIRFKLDVEWLQILLLFPIFQAFPRLQRYMGTMV